MPNEAGGGQLCKGHHNDKVGIFGPKGRSGNTVECNRVYYGVIYLQEDWAGADRCPSCFGKIILR